MKLSTPHFRVFDYIFAILAVGLITGATVAAYSANQGAANLHVQTVDGEFVYSLHTDAELDFEGPIGTTHIEIRDGSARVVSSPCREQICVNSGPLDKGGDWTACLPNRIFLEVTGEDKSQADAFSY